MTRCRAGFTLVELLVVLALLVPLWAAATSLATTSSRAAVEASRVSSAELAIAHTLAILEAELTDLVAGEDLILVTPTLLRFHAARGVGLVCGADSVGVRITAASWAATRAPVPGRDSVWVEQLAASPTPWRSARRVGLMAAPAAASCGGGVPALQLAADLKPILLPGLSLGPIARTTEVVELAAYPSGGSTWFGLRPLGLAQPVQPAAGPFAPGGLLFEGLDGTGAVTASPGRVRAIRVYLETPLPRQLRRQVIIALRG